MKQRVLVTGATGFLGRHLVRALQAQGHDVVPLARQAPRGFASEFGVEVVRGDVLDADAVAGAAKGCDVVFHAAGVVSRDPRDAEMLYRSHVVGTRTVLQAARAAGARRAVVASTSGTVAISETPKPIPNESSPTPTALIQRFPYYRAKLFAEQEAFAQQQRDFDVVCVNPALLLGPGDVNGSSTHDVRLFLDRAIPAIPAGGLSFVDARDVADAMMRAMERGEPGQRYLLGALNLTVRALFERLQRVSGVQGPRVPLPASVAFARASSEWLGRVVRMVGGEPPVDPVSVEMSQLYWYLDASRAERDLGWHARDPQETLADTVRDLRGDLVEGTSATA